jgi:hypothetical protein
MFRVVVSIRLLAMPTFRTKTDRAQMNRNSFSATVVLTIWRALGEALLAPSSL